jgi:pimeloyl-ACP methyl ester carboxylesterase
LLDALVNRFVFRPVKQSQDWQPAPAELHAVDVERPLRDGTPIHAWWCRPEGWQRHDGTVLISHGNAGNLSHRAESVRRWQTYLGRSVLIYDYPGYGRSAGKPSEVGCYAAAELMYRFLVEEQQISPDRVILYGGSIGGAMAIELARNVPHRALVLVSAFTSLEEMAGRQFPWLPILRRLVRHRFDNLEKIGSCLAPIFIAHGTEDRIVPFEQSQRLHRAARQPNRLFPMEGYDHMHTPGPDFYQAVRDFLASL